MYYNGSCYMRVHYLCYVLIEQDVSCWSIHHLLWYASQVSWNMVICTMDVMLAFTVLAATPTR